MLTGEAHGRTGDVIRYMLSGGLIGAGERRAVLYHEPSISWGFLLYL